MAVRGSGFWEADGRDRGNAPSSLEQLPVDRPSCHVKCAGVAQDLAVDGGGTRGVSDVVRFACRVAAGAQLQRTHVTAALRINLCELCKANVVANANANFRRRCRGQWR